MDNKKFENPEEVRPFPDSDDFANGFKKWLVNLKAVFDEVDQRLEPLIMGLQRRAEAAAPIISEFKKWDVGSEVLGKAGWLPHHTMPFDDIADYGEDIEAARSGLLDYYKSNWTDVRSEVESRWSGYKIDAEAKATFREALDAHESGLYRCVCRVLFPEIERVFRTKLFDRKIGPIPYQQFVKKLLDDKDIEDFVLEGLYDLSIFGHLTKAITTEDASGSDKLIYGLFQGVKNEADRDRLNKDPIPNRHAAIHGLVVYSSQQNSLNAIFMADYIFRIVTPTMSLPQPRENKSSGDYERR